MYRILLIVRYLRSKLAPMFAALAVMLCTAMVIIVISIMGGFLQMMRGAAKTLTGDVIVMADLKGFPHYQAMIQGLEHLPEVAAATPIIQTYGLFEIDNPLLRNPLRTVEVLGIEPKGLDAVTGFRHNLQWRNADVPRMPDFENYAMTFSIPGQWEPKVDELDPEKARGEWPRWGIIPGIAVFDARDEEGQYHLEGSTLVDLATVTAVYFSKRGDPVKPVSERFVIVNHFKSGLYEIDANRVYVPFERLQAMLRMDAHEIYDTQGQATGQSAPARASELMIRGAQDVVLDRVYQATRTFMQQFVSDHPDVPPLRVLTWQQRHSLFLGAIEKEKFLLTTLFGFISIVAVAMIAVIFYMIVLEKTHDIGVLRALGASQPGIAGIFLGYGLAIGVIGAGLGLALAATVVWNINQIQDYLAAYLGVTLQVVAAALAGALGGLLGGRTLALRGWLRQTLVALWILLAVTAAATWFWSVPQVQHRFDLDNLAAQDMSMIWGGRLTSLALLLAGLAGLGSSALGRRRSAQRDEPRWWVGLDMLAGLVTGLATGCLGLASVTLLPAAMNQHFGFRMWDPQVYYFDRVPNHMDRIEVAAIVAVAILSSVIGSLIPAILASRLNPVESLRYE